MNKWIRKYYEGVRVKCEKNIFGGELFFLQCIRVEWVLITFDELGFINRGNVTNLLNFREKETERLLFWSIFTAIKRENMI